MTKKAPLAGSMSPQLTLRGIKHLYILSLLLILCLSSNEYTMAQVSPTETINRDLGSITVYGSRLATSALTEGKDIQILSKETIATFTASSLDELLHHISGVNVTTRNGFGAQADIGIRGSTFAQILVLVDGQRINDPLTGHFNSYLSLPIEQIHQIEVIKGPSSASFGADAVGGVIAITTSNYQNYRLLAMQSSRKAIRDKMTGNKDYSYQMSSKIGSFGSQMLYSNLALNSGTATTDAYAEVTRIDGPSYVNPNYLAIDSAPPNYRSFYNQERAGISQSYHWNSGWSQYVRLGYDRREFNAKYFYTNSSYDESVEEVERYWGQLSTRKEIGNWGLEVDGMIQQTTDFFDFNPNFNPNEHTTTQAQFHTALSSLSESKLDYSLGVQALHKNIKSTDRGNHDRTGFASYVMLRDSWELNDGNYPQFITLNLSLRADYDPSYELKFIPQISAKWLHRWGILQSSAGKAIRAADFTELFVSHNLAEISSGRNLGNANLQAEESFAYDVSYETPEIDLRLVPIRVQYKTSYFARESNRLIDYVYTSAKEIEGNFNLDENGYYFFPQNVNSAYSFGVEQHISIAFRSSEALSAKDTETSISTQKTRNRNTEITANLDIGHSFIRTEVDGPVVSKYLLQHPRQQITTQFRLRTRGLGLHVQMRYLMVNEEFGNTEFFHVSSPQTWLDTKLTYQNSGNVFDLGHSLRTKWSFEIRNLLDREYQQILGARLPGRWISLGLSISSSKQ